MTDSKQGIQENFLGLFKLEREKAKTKMNTKYFFKETEIWSINTDHIGMSSVEEEVIFMGPVRATNVSQP